MTDEVTPLSDDEVAEVAEMFPHAEYQPDVEAMPLCSFCDGAIDDHKGDCVVPHVHALCATVRALRAEPTQMLQSLGRAQQERNRLKIGLSNIHHIITNERCDDAVVLGMATSAVGSLIRQRDELQSQLAQVTQERDEAIKLLSPDVSRDLLDAARHLVFNYAANKRSAERYQMENAALREENDQLRHQVTTLDGDLKGTVKHCNEYHEDHYPETS